MAFLYPINKFDVGIINNGRNTVIEIAANFGKPNAFRYNPTANDIKIAIQLNLDGVYLPSFNKQLKFNIFSKRKNFLIIGSAHNFREINIKQNQGCKLIFLAPIFKVSKKKHFLGINKFNQLSFNKKINFIALGGINNSNIKKINLLNCYGFAGISLIKKNGLRKLRPFLNCLNIQ